MEFSISTHAWYFEQDMHNHPNFLEHSRDQIEVRTRLCKTVQGQRAQVARLQAVWVAHDLIIEHKRNLRHEELGLQRNIRATIESQSD